MQFILKNRLLVGGLLFALGISIYYFWSNGGSSVASLPDEVDYNYHIRPILSDRCFKCHGPDANKREGDFRLDTEADAYKALKDNPKLHGVVPNDLDKSAVWLRITTSDTSLRMPPVGSNLKLNDHEIALIKKWIQQGAKYKNHWAFTAPMLPQKPEIDNEDWPKNDIDYFTLAKMEQNGLSPNEEADKERLLKRVSLDLTGLPPSFALQERFLNDKSENAYEKIIDELLKSKHYGEKMAVSWLDAARYADSHGYQDDGLRTMWPWRDWVIHAFNQNYGYDKFLTWQLAGDLLAKKQGKSMTDPVAKEMILATGFNRNHKITQEGGVVDEEYRIEYVTDRTNTFGKTFLGLTFECAKCHDHKYDPILQKDYFSTFAFFNQVPEKGIVGTIDASFADPPNMKITTDDVKNILKFINKKDTAGVMVMVMQDRDTLRPTHILNRGAYDQLGTVVTANLPKSILNFDTRKYAPNRLGLSQWMLDAKNPLTARVFVNKIWQEIFGKGIVKTVGDFGMQGDLPSHPELLDWLAVDFRTHGWDIKRLVKQIVMSATYRQSGKVSKKQLEQDPENVWLSHYPRTRLSAESVRDLTLSASGLLNPEIGGPSVKPYQPKGLWESATSGRGVLKSYIQDHDGMLYRRGMYVFIKRTVPPPTMLIFDASNRDQCEVKRSRTNTPLQALVMLNDPTVLESARVLSQKLSQEKTSNEAKIEKAFRQIVCRKPQSKEIGILNKYFDEERQEFTKNPKKVTKVLSIGEYPQAKLADRTSAAALMQTILMVYNLEETLMR